VLIAQAVAAALTDQHAHYQGSTGDLLSDGLLCAGLVLVLPGLHRLGATLAPRFGLAAVLGQGAVAISIAATVAVGHEALDVVYIIGAAALLIGSIAIAARAWYSQYRVAVALPMAIVAAFALADAGGAILLGLIWLALGARLTQTSG